MIYKKNPEEAKTDVFCKTVVLIIFDELPRVIVVLTKSLNNLSEADRF